MGNYNCRRWGILIDVSQGIALDGVRGVGVGPHFIIPDSDTATIYAVAARFDQLEAIVGQVDGSIAWTLGFSALIGVDLDQRLRADARLETGAAIGLGRLTLFPVAGIGVEQLGPIEAPHNENPPLGVYAVGGFKARAGIAYGFGLDLIGLYHRRFDERSCVHREARFLFGYGSPFMFALAYDAFPEATGLSTSLELAW